MNNKLLLLVGSGADSPVIPIDPEVLPSGQEPYRLIWNFDQIRLNLPQYVHSPSSLGYTSSVDVWNMLSDHPPLTFKPTIHGSDVVPVSVGHKPWSTMSLTPGPLWQPLKLDRVAEFANVHLLQGSEFKIFHLRYGHQELHDPMQLIRYNLNASGSVYVAIAMTFEEVNPGVFEHRTQLQVCPDGANIWKTEWIETTDILAVGPNESSDDIRLVITMDEARIYIGQPGTLLTFLPFPEQRIVRQGAHVEFFREYLVGPNDPAFNPGPEDHMPGYMFLESLIIYDGTF